MLLRTDVDPDSLVDEISSIVGVGPDEVSEDPSHAISCDALWVLPEDTSMRYEENDWYGSRIRVVGSTEEQVQRLIDLKRAHLSVSTITELCADIDSASDADQKRHALGRAAFGAPNESNEQILARVVEAMSSEDRWVRYWAVSFANEVSWQDLLPSLREVVELETDPGIRDFARSVIQVRT